MGVDEHVYGTVICGLLSRRRFILYFCAFAVLASAVELVSFAYGFFADGGIRHAANLEAAACVGSQCYEVWSCHGLKDATEHLREPFLQGLSLVSALFGFCGAYYGDRFQLHFGGLGMLLLGVFCSAVGIFDKVYTETCLAYPTDVVDAMLLRRVPPSPLAGGLQEKLRATVVYPVADVDAVTEGSSILAWYLAYLGFWAAVNMYAGYQARLLSELVEGGPLGLGVHFGMHQWDEFINHDELRKHCQGLKHSDFLEDAHQPLSYASVGYGAARFHPHEADELGRRPAAYAPLAQGQPLSRGGMIVL